MQDSTYGVRQYNLKADVPQALLPASSYILDFASDDTTLLIAIGDDNADFSRWPRGLAIHLEQGQKARIVSLVDQTVSVLYGKGGVVIDRPGQIPMLPMPGAAEYLGAGATYSQIASGTLLFGNSGENGAEVYQASIFGIIGGAGGDSLAATIYYSDENIPTNIISVLTLSLNNAVAAARQDKDIKMPYLFRIPPRCDMYVTTNITGTAKSISTVLFRKL